MIEYHHLEFIKQTMLKQEDTFRHQVKELHRLYHVQKNLISALRNDSTFVPRVITDTDNFEELGLMAGFDVPRHAKERMLYGESSKIQEDQTGPKDVELTLSIGPSITKTGTQNRPHQIGGNDSNMTMKTNLEISSTLYNQDTKRPHWLFQDLSLNRT
ncbi:hypothetical protein OSB04_un000660 [Centaurea solstitialis]|uniref:Uncharacterized protein n=1 Tax=Centaurea solstitialis TaxID=347529 RepID=A0AA38S3Q0_9ASTR|nr:hypothetical protein OSB04_un000660 [Centaurea solstitialis]